MDSTDKALNFFGERERTSSTVPRYEKIREAFLILTEFLNKELGPCRVETVEIAFERLKEASMWANFAISEVAPLITEKPPTKPTPASIKPKPATRSPS